MTLTELQPEKVVARVKAITRRVDEIMGGNDYTCDLLTITHTSIDEIQLLIFACFVTNDSIHRSALYILSLLLNRYKMLPVLSPKEIN